MSVTVSLNNHNHVFPSATGWRVDAGGILAVVERDGANTTVVASFRNWDYAIPTDD